MSVQERPDELIRLLRPEFAGRSGADSPASLTWGKIMLIPPAGAPVTTYPVTVAGLLAALAAATVAGSMIWVPPGSFNTAITIPANIALVALGEKVSINGQWTLNSGVVVANVVQTQSGSSAGALSGVIGPSSGIAYMKNCSISVENSGAGDAYAVNQSGAGELWLWACSTYGNASGGGSGYGARRSAGTLHVSDDGRHRGSTGKFSGKVELFTIDDVIHLKTSTFTQLYNATDAGLTAALAAASSGDTVRLPDRCNITSSPTVPAGVYLLGSGNKSIITGTVTNNGHIERVDIVGNLVNNETIDLVGVTCSSGNGIEQTSATASATRCGVNGQTGCTNQWYVTGGRVLFSSAGGNAKGKGIYANGATVQIFHSRFLGEIGGQIETVDIASNCEFLASTNTDGLYHTTGTGRIAHVTARSDGGTGVDVNLAAAGLTFQDVSFSTITGEANISYDRGDRSNYSVEDYHAADIEADVLTRHLPAPTSDAGDAGKSAVLNSGATAWELGSAVSGGGIFPEDPYTDTVANDGYADVGTNIGQRRNKLTSWETGGTVYQAITYWDSDDYLVIGKRVLDGAWTLYTYNGAGGLPTIQVTGTDGHDFSTIGIDPNGIIHVAYDMHGDALNYRKSDAAINSWTGGLTATLSMVGTNESAVTYPTFLNDPSGVLYFMFRDTAAGEGDWYFYKYTHGTTTWAAATGTGAGGKILDGTTPSNYPYIHYPAFDSDFGSGGEMHLAFHWRASAGDGNSNHDVGYVKWDGTNWTQDDGTAQTMPITEANDDTIDPVASGSGLNSLGSLASDSNGNPLIAYGKDGGDGFKHIFAAYYNGSAWTVTQVSTTPAPTGGDDTGIDLKNPVVVIDRTDDTAYIFYTDNRDVEGLILQKSDPGDFTNWTRFVIYPRSIGISAPNLDFAEFERNGLFYFPIFYWEDGETALPIRIFKWDDAVGIEQYKIQVEEHDHSGLGEGGEFLLTNLLSTGATNGQVPNADGAGAIVWADQTGGGSAAVFAPVTDGDIATPEIIFNNGEVVMNGVYH